MVWSHTWRYIKGQLKGGCQLWVGLKGTSCWGMGVSALPRRVVRNLKFVLKSWVWRSMIEVSFKYRGLSYQGRERKMDCARIRGLCWGLFIYKHHLGYNYTYTYICLHSLYLKNLVIFIIILSYNVLWLTCLMQNISEIAIPI